MARCRVLAAKCKFTDILETNVRLIAQLIVGTKHVQIQEKLLEKGDSLSSLDAALDIARTYEATKSHVAQLQATPTETVHNVSTNKKAEKDEGSRATCTRCGRDHSAKEKCPAQGDICKKCGKANHWAKVCMSKQTDRGRTGFRQRRGRSRSRSRQQKKESHVDDIADDMESLVFQSVTIDDVRDTSE